MQTRNASLPRHNQTIACTENLCKICNKFAFKQMQIRKLNNRFNELMQLNNVLPQLPTNESEEMLETLCP